MLAKRLELTCFRNYAAAALSFAPGVNILCGENAQGKTNLLEAISYLTAAKSFRTRRDNEVISFGSEEGRINARIFARERDFTLETRMRAGVRRSVVLNGVKIKTAAELSGVFSAIVFCPEDLQLIREGAAARRRFLDNSLCQLRPRYAAALAEYGRAYEHKTRILRDHHEKPSLLDTLDAFNLRMAQAGAVLIRNRAAFVKKLSAYAAAIHADCSGGRETLVLRYETVETIRDTDAPERELCARLLEHQEKRRRAELDARLCLSGPHRDELSVEINGRAARTYASQGQTRTAALALKLAECELHDGVLGERPVLLLDDVLSELDPRRQEFVRSRITGGQVFITCCDEKQTGNLDAGQIFRIRNGEIH